MEVNLAIFLITFEILLQIDSHNYHVIIREEYGKVCCVSLFVNLKICAFSSSFLLIKDFTTYIDF